MKKLIFALCLLLFATMANAQWKTETYVLKGGWNAIYLHGDASYDTIDNLITNTNVTEIWRWNTNPSQVQFTTTPLIPSAGTAEWNVWKRGVTAETTLTRLTGQCAYLVKCVGTSGNTYNVSIKQSPMLPANSWVRNGANLLGFPTLATGTGTTFPTFANYFATFPIAISTQAAVFKYVGGDLASTNPLKLFSTNTEQLDRNKAYWFSAEVTGDFYAPIEVGLSGADGVAFGRSVNSVTLRLRNRTSAPVTVTLTPAASEAAPAYVTTVAGSVSLTQRTFNAATGSWTSTALTSATTQVIGPQSTVEIVLGIDRTTMTGATNALYASLLRLTESSNLMDVYLPVTAMKDSLAGLWVGDIQLNSVSSKVSNPGRAKATLTNGVVTGLSVDGSGGFGYVTAPTVTITAPAGNDMKLATATSAFSSANRTVTSLTLTEGGFGYNTAPAVTLSAPTASVSAMRQ